MAGPHGILNGTEIKIYIDNALVAYATSGSLNISMDTRESTGLLSQAWKNIVEGDRSWSVDLDGMYAWETDAGGSIYNADWLFDTYLGSRREFTIVFGTKDNESGDVKYSGKGFLTSLSMSGSTEDSATFSASFEGNGELTLTEY
tara:strand:- start:7281 stop:7715 length:435 start_codon:yes stop_codon:yes gene_type:complete